jgi:diaminopimelate decarboxylase
LCARASGSAAPSILDVFPSGTRRDADGVLVIGGCRVDELAQAYGTPALVVDEAHLRATVRRYRDVLAAAWPDSQVTYASKAFAATAVYRVMSEEGIWVDVAGAGELEVALGAGVDPATILVHGNAKSDELIARAVGAGVAFVVVDNLDDIDRLERHATSEQQLLIRLNPDVAPDTHEAMSTGGHGSKFGLPVALAREVCARIAASRQLTLAGVHIHIGSQIRDVEPFAESARALRSLVDELGLADLTVYDLGGGLGVPHLRGDRVPSIEEYVAGLVEAVRGHLPPGARVLVEPGRSLVATAGVSLYRVVTVKRAATTFVAVDGGMGDNLEVSLYGQPFEALIAAQADPSPREPETCDVVGHHCESGDRLVADIELAQPAVGDVLAVPVTGAYTFPMSNNYNGALRPPVVFISDGHHRAVIRRETFADLVRRDVPG